MADFLLHLQSNECYFKNMRLPAIFSCPSSGVFSDNAELLKLYGYFWIFLSYCQSIYILKVWQLKIIKTTGTMDQWIKIECLKPESIFIVMEKLGPPDSSHWPQQPRWEHHSNHPGKWTEKSRSNERDKRKFNPQYYQNKYINKK
jgi:hypothetical protein